jgi:hypothetical protein
MKYDSRYRDAESLIVQSHSYDILGKTEIDPNTESPVRNIRSTLYRLTTLPLPDPPDYQHQVKVTDDMPKLAHQYMGDPQKWWVLADANPHIRHPLDLKTPDIIWIP